jgi:hypothetical protein
MTQGQLVRRVDELEREVRLLRQKIGDSQTQPPRKSADDFFGMFHGDPYFERAMKYAAEYRRSLRPARRAKKARSK